MRQCVHLWSSGWVSSSQPDFEVPYEFRRSPKPFSGCQILDEICYQNLRNFHHILLASDFDPKTKKLCHFDHRWAFGMPHLWPSPPSLSLRLNDAASAKAAAADSSASLCLTVWALPEMQAWFSGTGPSASSASSSSSPPQPSLLAEWNSYAAARSAEEEEDGGGGGFGIDIEAAVRSANDRVSGTFGV